MERLKLSFERFANNEADGKSPLYAYWCRKIVEEEALLPLIQHIPSTQPKPNLFFASIQYLSMQKQHELAGVFEHPTSISYEESFAQLVNFCNHYENELIHLFKTKLVQTNEVQRASYLYPIFSHIAAETHKPLTLIEIGTSAGLLLLIDAYRYQLYQKTPIVYGNQASPLLVTANNFGEQLHAIKPFKVNHRIGIDLNIVDVKDAQQMEWLNSLIWPELKQRKINLEIAATIQKQYDVCMVKGDFRTLLPKTLKKLQDTNSQIVIFHTHVANQFSMELKKDLLTVIDTLSETQPIYHVYNNLYDNDLHVDYVHQKQTLTKKQLSNTDGHGNYFYWA
jgi:hypothetical protein